MLIQFRRGKKMESSSGPRTLNAITTPPPFPLQSFPLLLNSIRTTQQKIQILSLLSTLLSLYSLSLSLICTRCRVLMYSNLVFWFCIWRKQWKVLVWWCGRGSEGCLREEDSSGGISFSSGITKFAMTRLNFDWAFVLLVFLFVFVHCSLVRKQFCSYTSSLLSQAIVVYNTTNE